MYVDTGTFWAIIIGLVIAIGAVYYVLNDKIKRPLPPEQYDKTINDIKKEITGSALKDMKNMATIMDNNFDTITNNLDEKVKEICGAVELEMDSIKGRILSPEDIEKIVEKTINGQHRTNKRSLNEITELYARIENLEEKNNIKPPKIKESSSGIGIITK